MPQTFTEAQFNGHSMVGPLQKVIVCSPRVTGWNLADRSARWRELGFRQPPDFLKAQSQHEALIRELETADVQVFELPAAEDLSLDAVYAHDASLATDFGMIIMRPGKPNRLSEGELHASFFTGIGIAILGTISPPGTTEAGDMIWLDAKTLLVGRGYRTNASGIAQMQAILAPKGIEVLSAPLPYGNGPSECLHLMSLISLLNDKTALVDLPWLSVETVEMLTQCGFRFIQIEDSERESLACNVLALGGNRLLAIEENYKTNNRLRHAGFDVRTFPGGELCINGGGGPTCLTRPILRG